MTRAGGDTYRCAACGGAIADHVLRASKAHPLGEVACPHCGNRVARLADGAWRPWLQTAMVFLGVLGVSGLVREGSQGTWWPYALVVASSAWALWQFRTRPDRVFYPVASD